MGESAGTSKAVGVERTPRPGQPPGSGPAPSPPPPLSSGSGSGSVSPGEDNGAAEMDEEYAEARTAELVGLDVLRVSRVEKMYLGRFARGDNTDADNLMQYAMIRNHVLSKWRASPRKFLSCREAGSGIKDRHAGLVRAAWWFLCDCGWINFGTTKAIARGLAAAEGAAARSVLGREAGRRKRKASAVEGEEGTEGEQMRQVDVVVVGAGMSGLAAARQLANRGYTVAVVEARRRLGGRVHSATLQGATGRGGGAVVDLGGAMLTGVEGNPLAVLAAQISGQAAGNMGGNRKRLMGREQQPMHVCRSACRLYDIAKGTPCDEAVDRDVESKFNLMLDESGRIARNMEVRGLGAQLTSLETALCAIKKRKRLCEGPGEMKLLGWHYANLEYGNGARLRDLSLTQWNQDDAQDMEGAHCLLAGGNKLLVEALADPEHVPSMTVHTDCIVSSVEHGRASLLDPPGQRNVCVRAKLRSPTGIVSPVVFEAAACILTCPLGVLKASASLNNSSEAEQQGRAGGPLDTEGCVRIDPPLPPAHARAVGRMGYGLLNKVALAFPHRFWLGLVDGGEADFFGVVHADPKDRGRFFQFWSLPERTAGGHVLIALIAGDAAYDVERMREADAQSSVMRILTTLCAPLGETVPPPIKCVFTRWGTDIFSRGSYSHLRPGSFGADYDTLASPIDLSSYPGSRAAGPTGLFLAGEHTCRRYPATMHGAFLSGTRAARDVLALLRGSPLGLFARCLAQNGVEFARDRTGSAAAVSSALTIVREACERGESADPFTLAVLLNFLFATPDHTGLGGRLGAVWCPIAPEGTEMALLRLDGLQESESGAKGGYSDEGESHCYVGVTRNRAIQLATDARGMNEALEMLQQWGVRMELHSRRWGGFLLQGSGSGSGPAFSQASIERMVADAVEWRLRHPLGSDA